MSDFKDEETPAFTGPTKTGMDLLEDHQRKLLGNLADLRLTLESEAKQAHERYETLTSSLSVIKNLTLTILNDNRQSRKPRVKDVGPPAGIPERRKSRRDLDEITDKFQLPAGIGHLELTRESQKRFLNWVYAILAVLSSHVVHWLITRR